MELFGNACDMQPNNSFFVFYASCGNLCYCVMHQASWGEMIIIGICDDESKHRQNVINLCERYFTECPLDHKYVEFMSGEEAFSYQGERILLLFLDIEMGETSGLDVLDRLRSSDKIWRIAFASNHGEQRLDTIDLKTLAFLDKPLPYEGVKRCLQIAIKENNENISAFFTLIDGKKSIELSEIAYIQAERHYVSVFTKQDCFMSFDSLKQVEERLCGTSVMRIHKSYLVNMQYVKKMSAEEVIMSDGTRLQIGRRYHSKVKDGYHNYIRSVTIGRKLE